MRLSTSMIYDQGYAAIARQQQRLATTQQQLSSGTRLLSPADDPVAAAQVQVLSAASDQNGLYAANVATATSAQQSLDATLSQVTDLLQQARTLAVNAGSPSLSQSDRASIATQLSGLVSELAGVANAKDANGNYLFSGTAVGTRPFALTPQGATYAGDQGVHAVQVSASRTIPTGVSGAAVFLAGSAGNGTFTARAAAANTGSGVIDAGSVVNPAALTGDRYTLAFSVAAGTTTYDVVDTTTGTTLSSGNAYTDGQAIAFAGMQVSITGSPANGDQFALQPAGHQNVFATLQALVATLATPAAAPGSATTIANGVAAALQDLDQGIDNVLAVRAQSGAYQNELDALAATQTSQATSLKGAIAGLQDLDYNKAVSDFAQQQVALQAAQQSFSRVTQLSLFNYLGNGGG